MKISVIYGTKKKLDYTLKKLKINGEGSHGKNKKIEELKL